MGKRIYILSGILSGLMLLNNHPAFAVDNYSVDGDNYSYNFAVYNKGESIILDGKKTESPFTVEKKYLDTLFTAAQKWASILETAQQPRSIAGYAIFSLDDYNASATSPYTKIKESSYPVTIINSIINGRTAEEDDDDDDDGDTVPDNIHGFIFIGHGISKETPGWQEYSGLHSLFRDKPLPDMHTVLLHEIMHSIGIVSDVAQQRENTDKKGFYFTEKDDDNLTVFDKDLRVYTGSDATVFYPDYEIIPTSTMKVGKNQDFDVITYSPYFIGETTLKVLAGNDNYMDARVAIIQNGGLTNYSATYDTNGLYPQVYGMPIHNADGDDDIDLSHLELRNSFMSHQSFRNWLVPMEAELAVLKDIGYNIELRKFFGKSYYLNNITDNFSTGYSQWNGNSYTGNPSTVTQGVGLHIYGNNNNITQASNISTEGEGSFGVRVDGVANTYSLASGSSIKANGKENLGIAVTWGKNHVINITENSSVEAIGEKGIAAAFDFGDNLFGNLSDVRGSYIKYISEDKTNTAPSQDHDEALVKQFNVAGTLTGAMAAIYIANNAHVREINILRGAQINGDIVSKWNSVVSGKYARVLTKQNSDWYFVDGSDINQIYFTDLNIADDFNGTINGKIDGETSGNNTLRLYNGGRVNINGDCISVFTLRNEGSITIDDAYITVQMETIKGDGELNVKTELRLGSAIKYINNTLNLEKNALLSTINGEIANIDIAQLNTDKSYISFDLGDQFTLHKQSKQNTISITQIKIDNTSAADLEDGATYKLFADEVNVLDFGDSYANIYYNGKRYHVTQDTKHRNLLNVKLSGENTSLSDAVQDETSAGYIVTEAKQNKDIGTVQGDSFEISGRDIDINGYRGMVVDGRYNEDGTTLKTGIYGAEDENIKIVNNGNLIIAAQDRDITVGLNNEKSLYIKNSEVSLDAENFAISVLGEITGADGGKNLLNATGKAISLHKVTNLDIAAQNTDIRLDDFSQNTVWRINNTHLTIGDDAYMSFGSSNQIVSKYGTLDFINGKASDITFYGLILDGDTTVNVDVDFAAMTADRLALPADENLIVNDASINVGNINLTQPQTILTAKQITIPFVDEELHNTNLLGRVNLTDNTVISTPIFNYVLGYEEDTKSGSFVFQRGDENEYGSYNPAIMTSPVASLSGGYLNQLYAYDEAFNNMDSLQHTDDIRNYDAEKSELLPDKQLWLRPYSSFEKVDLKNGPKTRNNMYGAYFGANSRPLGMTNGWNFKYGLYSGYNASRQRYSGDSIHQNGGTIGVAGYFYKNNFFGGLTLNTGIDEAKATTMYGKENFYIFRYGLAAKTGYNWMLRNNKLVIQPNYLMSLTSVSTSDYRNAVQVKIKSHPLYALNIAPGIKVAYNAANNWLPYANVKLVWSILDKTNFKAQDVNLPEIQTKPYIQYGLGLQKNWNQKLSGYIQTDFRSLGRSGVDFTAGIRWTFN